MSGFGSPANKNTKKSTNNSRINQKKWFSQAIYSHQTGRLKHAETIYKKLINAGTCDPAVFCNLGIICKNSGRIKEALEYYEQALDHEPGDPKIYSNIGNLYRDIGSLDKALQFTLKSLELNQNESNVHMNLGGIYQDLGRTEQALASIIKAIELDADNIEAHNNLKNLASNIQIGSVNHADSRKAYELLLDRKDFFHRKLCPLFMQQYLDEINKAAESDPIISDQNQAFHQLASDWIFTKSLTLIIPPHQDIEIFLTRVRKEFLSRAHNGGNIPENLRPLTEALAVQCFLNEYVYSQSLEEEEWVEDLIIEARKGQDSLIQYLPIISCYIPIHEVISNKDTFINYPITGDESQALTEVQFSQIEQERLIKTRLVENKGITNTVSLAVQAMYEENPYPRYRFADFTNPTMTRPVPYFISNETTTSDLPFTPELSAPGSRPRILIAGCGTGNQIINASRYKNAQITAIDLSKSSLAYAQRTAQMYGMSNIQFHHLDILDASQLQQSFDVIECGGVLHHMDDPARGLASLTQQLKPGGFIKIGLYSALARRAISSARNTIQKLGIESTPRGIRKFRQDIFNGQLEQIKGIAVAINDFYSLSECRDLCFHVQEHQFSTDSLKTLLNNANLVFCGFMLPTEIKTAYQQQYPEDSDADSLDCWGEFERQNQSIFQSMYQFWARKPA